MLGFKVGSSTSLLLQTVGVLLNKSNITAIKPLSGETRGRDRTRDSLERGAIKILHNLRLLQQHYFVEKLSMVYFNSVDASWTLLQTRNLINVLFFSFILSPCLPWAVSATHCLAKKTRLLLLHATLPSSLAIGSGRLPPSPPSRYSRGHGTRGRGPPRPWPPALCWPPAASSAW